MNYENCPNWLCNHQNIPYDYVYFLVGIVFSLPYVILLIYLYKKWKNSLNTKRKYFTIVSIPIGYLFYCWILTWLFIFINDGMGFIGMIGYTCLLSTLFLIPFSVLGLIIGIFIKFDKR